MAIIRDLKIDSNGCFLKGKFDSYSLFTGEMNISIFADGADEADALRCVEHYNSLSDKPDILRQIQDGLESFFLYMYDEWQDFGDIFEDILSSLEPVMMEYKEGRPLVSFLYRPVLYVFPQLENEIGYGIECECPWEPEHQCMILIRNDRVVYAGPSGDLDPWQDEEEYYCIWNDTEEQ